MPALRLCPDDWIAKIVKDQNDRSEIDRLRDPVEELLWDLAKKTLLLGIDVILEYGFWSREERSWFRGEAEAIGAHVEVKFLLVDKEELWSRLSKRNVSLDYATFYNSRKELEASWNVFEPPSEEEQNV